MPPAATASDPAVSNPSTSRWLDRHWSFALAVLVGAALRLDQIGIQIPIDDEWHTLHAVARFGYGHVLTHFGWTDFCIPLTLFYKLVTDSIGLSEPWLRLPVLCAGIASLAVLPLTVRAWLGGEAATVFAWLLAVSPLHVYFSRYARQYSIALLLTFLALFALAHVRVSRRSRWAWAYGIAAVLAPYFHLMALPLVLLPLGLAWTETLTRRTPGPVIRHRLLAILSAGVVLGLLALIGPPLLVDHVALSYKAGRGTPGGAMWSGAAQLIAGSGRTPGLALVGLLATAGSMAVLRRQRPFAAYLALVAAVTLVVPLASRAALIEYPIVFARYCLILLPLLLMLAARGFVALLRLIGVTAAAGVQVGAPVLAAVVLWLGPIPALYPRPNSWTNHPGYQHSYWTPPCGPQVPVPAFYAWLGRWPAGSQRLVEAPWSFAGASNDYHCYQRVHRQHVLIGFVGDDAGAASESGIPRPGELPILSRPRAYRLSSFVHLGADDEMRRRGVRFVVLHKVLGTPAGGRVVPSATGIGRWIRRYRGVYGEPVYEDGVLAVFEIGRPRDAAPATPVE